MGIGVQTLKLVSILIAFSTEVKVVTVMAHPAFFTDLNLAGKAFILLINLILGLNNHLHLMFRFMVLRVKNGFSFRPLKETFLT